MDIKTLNILEYENVKNKLYQYKTTQMADLEIKKLSPMSNFEKIRRAILQTKDGMNILRLKGGIPIPKLISIDDSLKRLEIGATLNGKELATISKILQSTNEILRFFSDLKKDMSLFELDKLVKKLNGLPEINALLLNSIEVNGRISDNASVLLKNLRRSILKTEEDIRNKLLELTRGKFSKYLNNATVTIRNERYVLPVKSEYRNNFGGIVHDQSSSGATLFVEPREVVELNNRLKKQQVEKKQEIIRILHEIASKIAPYTVELKNNAYVLGKFDFINAKAKYASFLNATEPILSKKNEINLREVWHPLLNSKKVVKNNISLGIDYKSIIITGPNTGGKTITLKTIGIIQMMGQSGLFIPALEESKIGIFEDVFADIGDEQSIEQSLSTFSSHMKNIVRILKKANDQSLVLFDELGAGTDPKEGAALAMAILDNVSQKGSYVVATTHYPELKAYGYNRADTINASMEFDSQTLRPTYRLLVGIPGRSNALDISKRLGLSLEIIDTAKQLISKDSQDLNDMIENLVLKRRSLEKESLELKLKIDEAKKLHFDLENKYNIFVTERQNMINLAKQEANEIVENAKHKSQEIIAKLQKMTSNQNVLEIAESKRSLNELHQKIELSKNKVLRKEKAKKIFKPNDDVLVKSYGQRGILLRKIGESWEVQIGILKMKISEDDIEKVKQVENKPQQKFSSVKKANEYVSPTLNLRGQRFEEAITNLERYIDSAILAGYPSVTIIHGKGTGALKKGVTDYLSSNRAVSRFEFAPPNTGGNGATIVYFDK